MALGIPEPPPWSSGSFSARTRGPAGSPQRGAAAQRWRAALGPRRDVSPRVSRGWGHLLVGASPAPVSAAGPGRTCARVGVGRSGEFVAGAVRSLRVAAGADRSAGAAVAGFRASPGKGRDAGGTSVRASRGGGRSSSGFRNPAAPVAGTPRRPRRLRPARPVPGPPGVAGPPVGPAGPRGRGR